MSNRSIAMTLLDYASPQTWRRRRRWPWRMIAGVVVVLVALLVLPAITVRQVESRIDVVTGSMTRTTSFFGMTSAPRVDASPLEMRLKARGIPWTPAWQFLHRTHRNIFGAATCRASGRAPAIHQLRPVLQAFVAASSDAELRQFVRIMESGTEAEQEAAVEEAAGKALQRLSRGTH